MRTLIPVIIAITITGLACSERDPMDAEPASFNASATAPTPLMPVSFGAWQMELWPFTANALNGAASDPINLLFPNRDARGIRASLMFLGGDRSAFGLPNAPPFNCVWKDAVGDPQSGYTTESGWTASVIQLECGDFAPMRFHVRLFPAGTSTIANAHFEVIIPGTNEHEVLSWELAELLVKIDFLRSGLLDPSAPFAGTPAITPAPTYRTINPLIYNGLPAALRALIGGPAANATAPVPIPNDGSAVILNLASVREAEPVIARRQVVIEFNQIIPKPFCSDGPLDYLRVVGAINIDQTIKTKPNGAFTSQFHAIGSLTVTAVNPLTGQLVGDSYKAVINEQQRNVLTDDRTLVTMLRLQKLIAMNGAFQGMLSIQAVLGADAPQASVTMKCAP